MRGKTIQIFLTNGTPRGIKFADITNNIEQAIFIPRAIINEASKINEAFRPGIYFLFGEDEDSSKPLVYIGKSKNCIDRIKTHDQKKDFWNYAVLIISKTESFTPTHIEFLEQIAIEKASESNRYKLENQVNPNKFKVSESLKADLLDNFDTIKILLSTLGFTLFEPMKKAKDSKKTFFCESENAKAEGEYQSDGFVIYAGSIANMLSAKCNDSIKNLRNKLLNDKILIEKNNVLEFQENYLFKTPSAAASQVLGYNTNGWLKWKNNNNKTLDEIIRQ